MLPKVVSLLLAVVAWWLGSTAVAAAQQVVSEQNAPLFQGRPVTNKPAPNSVFFEGLGAGLYYSINYERRVIDDVGVRAGLSYLSLSTTSRSGDTRVSTHASYVTIPITVSYLGVRGRRSGLEVGGGLTLAYAAGTSSTGVSSTSGSGMTPFITGLVGYRLHPVDGAGFQFRVGLTALMAKGLSLSSPNPNRFGVLPWPYISFGAGF